jgi:cyanophycinase
MNDCAAVMFRTFRLRAFGKNRANHTLFPRRASFLTIAISGCLVSAAAITTNLALAEGPKSGRLVIVGGALDPKHEAVYQSLLVTAPDNQPVAIVPLASGVPEESGPLSVQDFQQYAKNPERIFDTKLVYTEPEKAATQESADALKKCGAIWFTGGDQSRIVNAMRPGSGDTVCYQAVLDVLTSGGTIGGSSAGAAMMSDP